MKKLNESSLIIGLTFSTVFILGVATAITLRPSEIDLPISQRQMTRQLASQNDDSPLDLPASKVSMPTPSSEIREVSSKAEDRIDLECIQHRLLTTQYTVQEPQIRVIGRFCDKKIEKSGKHKNLQIINQTNGFSGTVFFYKQNIFTSDYIYLSPGKNQLLVSWDNTSPFSSPHSKSMQIILTRKNNKVSTNQ